jgi:hypothetical protein
MARWSSRSSVVPGAIGLSIQSLNDMEELIQSVKTGSREFEFAMNVAAQMMAKLTQGHAQRLYRGPRTRPEAARQGLGAKPWTIPVRRLTERTYRGWRVKRLRFGAWEVFNEERGAYMVEFGVVRGGGGQKRPILKMSGNAAMEMAMRSKLGNRIYGQTFGNLKMNKGRFGNFGRMEGSVYLQ